MHKYLMYTLNCGFKKKHLLCLRIHYLQYVLRSDSSSSMKNSAEATELIFLFNASTLDL